MLTLVQHVDFVKGLISFQDRMAKKFADDAFRSKLHKDNSAKLKALLTDLEAVNDYLGKIEAQRENERKSLSGLSLKSGDLIGLPEALIQELSLANDKTEFAILEIFNESGGISSLDKLLVGLYRKTGEIHKRNTLTSRLYRMIQKDMLYSVPGKKGIYATRPISEDEAADLFGGEKDDY